MARIPTVGTKGVHTVQLSPRLRRIEARRTRNAARRANAPVIAADKAALREAGGTYNTQVQSIKGATAMTDSALLQALRGGLGGLKGKYKQQVKSELLARLHDAAATVPSLVAEAGENRAQETREARQNLMQDRASMLREAATAFNSRLQSLRDKGATALKEREEGGEGGENPLAPDPRGVHNAYLVGANGLQELINSAGKWIDKDGNIVEPHTEGAKPIHPPETDAEWRAFAENVAKKADSADQTDALRAVEILRQRYERHLHQGKIKQPGVPAPRG